MNQSPISSIYIVASLIIVFLLLTNPEPILTAEFFITGVGLTAFLIFCFVRQQVGWLNAIYLLILSCTIGFTMELLGVHSHTFFSEYHYSDFLGYQLWGVPILIAPAWFIATTTAFVTARAILGFGKRVRPLRLFSLSALIAVVFDLPVEYLAKHVWQAWSWTQGGPLLDVPTLNYVGWFVVAFLIFGLSARQWKQINRVRRGYVDLQIICWSSFGLLIIHMMINLLTTF